MELDELKNAWIALDNRLKRNEELKENIILEMMRSKAGKLINRFIILEIISLVIILLVIPVIIFWLDNRGGKYITADVVMYLGLIICIIYPFWGAYKIRGLMKIDLSKNVSNNIFYINRYNIQYKREFKSLYFIGPVFVILTVLYYAAMKVTLPLWTLLTCSFIAMIFILYWTYKFFNKRIESVLKSLDEIKELKEE